MDTENKPVPVEVQCSRCEAKIGEYVGPIGYDKPILSRYFVRNDKTRPAHGSSSAGICPACKVGINELECTMLAIASKLAQITAAATLAEEPPNEAEVKAAEVPPILHAVNEADDDLSSDCHS